MAREGTPSETGLYLAIEKHLKASKEPLTCVELFEFNDVRSAAETVNKVSDALGHLWRRKFIERRVTPKSPHHQDGQRNPAPRTAAGAGAYARGVRSSNNHETRER
jgi:hypothetical protein